MVNIIREHPLRSENFWIGKDGLDEGIYKEAAKQGKTVSMLLEDMKADKKSEPTPYQGMTKGQVMQMRKSMQSAGQLVPLTALEECFKQSGIKAFGSYRDPYNKFFEIADMDVLFPEYVSDRVYTSMMLIPLVSEFVAGEVVVPSEFYLKIYLNDVEDDRQLREVSRGAEFPTTRVQVGKHQIRLVKYGRVLEMAYEDTEQRGSMVLDAALRKIAMQIMIDATDDMVYTLLNGDGNSSTTPTNTTSSTTTGVVVLDDLIAWATNLNSPYKMNKFVGRKTYLRKYYKPLASFVDPVATWGFVGLDLPKPFEWDRSVLTSDIFIGVDQRFAIEHLTMGGPMTETDKLIRKQVNGTAISWRSGFSIIDPIAVGKFDIDH